MGDVRLETAELLEDARGAGMLQVLDNPRIERRPERRAEIASHVDELPGSCSDIIVRDASPGMPR